MIPRAVALGAALLLAGAGCSSVHGLSFPNPPPTTVASGSVGPTLPTDLSAVGQAGVPGATTTTLPPIGPGRASLNGTVFGPTGPVGGATVQVDRLVGDAFASARTTTAPDGTWMIPNILGGRYRVRAWQAPNLDLTTPQIMFLGGTQSLSVALQLNQFKGPQVAISIAPSAPQVKRRANLVVQVTNPTVGADGVLTNPGVAGATVTLTNGPNWLIYNGNPQVTDASGDALFQVTCQKAGKDPLAAQVDSNPPVPLHVPVCAKPPPPTTTTSTTFPPPCQTTTTVFGFATTTTSLAFGFC